MQPASERCVYQFVKYGLVGVLNTAIFGALCWIGAQRGWHYVAYTALAYTVAILFSYTANYRFTFKTTRLPKHSFLRFILVCFSLVAVSEGLQLLQIEIFHIPEAYAIILTMILYTLTGFCINKYWVFNG